MNFMTKTIAGAEVLINNMAASNKNTHPDYDKIVQTTNFISTMISDLTWIAAQFLKLQIAATNQP